MSRIISLNQADGLSVTGQQNIPLVIIKSLDNDNIYEGFVPGFNFSSIVNANKNLVIELLKNKAIEYAKKLYNSNKPFPFFPTKEEIYKDIEKVVEVRYIKISSLKRKEEI